MSRAWHVWIITEGSHVDIHSAAGPIGGSIVGKEDLELVAHDKVLV
jgi:hypothetical protein